MIKTVPVAAALSLIVFSGAWALPASPTMQPLSVASTDLVQIKNKWYSGKKNKHYKKYNRNYNHYGRYHYRNKYWKHRYSSRPYNWQTLGCIAAGPIWYCP